jgi:diguanylate cyclase (GGDEF)-like protein
MFKSMANTDSLTGVRNKHAYSEYESKLNDMIRAGELKNRIAVLVCDINGLKYVNDTKGHAAGDMLIKEACDLICEHFTHGAVFRIGGDEFVVILYDRGFDKMDESLAAINREVEDNIEKGNVVVAVGHSVLTEEDEQIQNQINQIVARMQRRKRNMSSERMEHFISMTGGKDPTQVIQELQGLAPAKAKERLRTYAPAIRLMQEAKAIARPIVISTEEDELLSHTRGYGDGVRPEDYLDAFAEYIKTNMNEIAALKLVCTRPGELTRESLKSLRLTLDREGFTTQQLNTAISELTNEEIAADIISLIRRYAIGSTLISHEARIRRAVDKLRKAHSFSKQELNWIGRMEKYLMEESVLNVSVFDEDGRFRAQGGFAKIDKVFQNQLKSVVLELNEYLYDDGGHTA